MPQIPREQGFDQTLALLRDPYHFIARRCRRHGADLFETRLLLQPTICLTGPEAAALFYDPQRFMRQGAMPGAIRKTLLGVGGVQGLDGEAHRHRKRMFMALMSPEAIDRLVAITAGEWEAAAARWASRAHVTLYDEARELLTRAVCAWAGVPLPEDEVGLRTAQLSALFDRAGSVGPGHLWARLARHRAERWLEGLIRRVREGELPVAEGSPLSAIATHRDPGGEPLSLHVAAVELLNLLRPTVAVAVYVVFVAHALSSHPEARARLRAGEEGYEALFVHEVRRFYPFFPAVAARVREDFEWRGYRFARGRRVLLDLHGTNHDPRTWEAPEAFSPERFRSWDGSAYNFIPQGGGDHETNHRCAGEWITIAIMQHAARFLATRLTYEVPDQDLRIDEARLPALPRSRFVMRHVRPAG